MDWLFARKDILRSRTFESHVRPPTVVPLLEGLAEMRKVIVPFDDRHTMQPFVSQGFDRPFRHRNRAVLPNRTQSMLHTAPLQQIRKSRTPKDRLSVRDQMSRCAIALERFRQGLDHPNRVRSFQGHDRYYLS